MVGDEVQAPHGGPVLTLFLACAPDPDPSEQDAGQEARMAPALAGILRSWFLDADRDGYGEPGTAILSATQPRGHVDNAMDCDDDDPATYPGAAYKEVRATCKTDAD